jgi:hypothetical protein
MKKKTKKPGAKKRARLDPSVKEARRAQTKENYKTYMRNYMRENREPLFYHNGNVPRIAGMENDIYLTTDLEGDEKEKYS